MVLSDEINALKRRSLSTKGFLSLVVADTERVLSQKSIEEQPVEGDLINPCVMYTHSLHLSVRLYYTVDSKDLKRHRNG